MFNKTTQRKDVTSKFGIELHANAEPVLFQNLDSEARILSFFQRCRYFLGVPSILRRQHFRGLHWCPPSLGWFGFGFGMGCKFSPRSPTWKKSYLEEILLKKSCKPHPKNIVDFSYACHPGGLSRRSWGQFRTCRTTSGGWLAITFKNKHCKTQHVVKLNVMNAFERKICKNWLML